MTVELDLLCLQFSTAANKQHDKQVIAESIAYGQKSSFLQLALLFPFSFPLSYLSSPSPPRFSRLYIVFHSPFSMYILPPVFLSSSHSSILPRLHFYLPFSSPSYFSSVLRFLLFSVSQQPFIEILLFSRRETLIYCFSATPG